MIDYKNWGKYIVNGNQIRGDSYPTDVRFKRNLDKWLRNNPGKTLDADVVLYTFQSQTEDDTWDIPHLDPKNKTERVDYPTQKPEALLKRIIAATSKPGDLILDCFAGSGTTLVVAEKLDRRWIGVDLSLSSIYSTQKRLLNLAASAALTATAIKVGRAKPACCGNQDCEHCAEFCCRPRETVVPVAYGKPTTPFAVYSSGHYDFHKLKALPFDEYRTFVLRLFGAAEQPEMLNGLTIDGRHRGDPVIIFDFHVDPDAQVTIEYFEELATFLEGRVRGRLLFIAPAASLALFDDRLSMRGIDFEIRRVPYSVVAAMSDRTNQATSEADINRIIETKGFDFGAPPEVEIMLDPTARTLTITRFRSRAIVKDLSEEKRGFESLAMVLVDYDHNGSVFDLDRVEFAEQLESKGWRVDLLEAKTGEEVAVSICDLFGNEHVQVFRDQEWGRGWP